MALEKQSVATTYYAAKVKRFVGKQFLQFLILLMHCTSCPEIKEKCPKRIQFYQLEFICEVKDSHNHVQIFR